MLKQSTPPSVSQNMISVNKSLTFLSHLWCSLRWKSIIWWRYISNIFISLRRWFKWWSIENLSINNISLRSSSATQGVSLVNANDMLISFNCQQKDGMLSIMRNFKEKSAEDTWLNFYNIMLLWIQITCQKMFISHLSKEVAEKCQEVMAIQRHLVHPCLHRHFLW